MLEVHSDLMGASRVEDRFGKSCAVQSFEHAVRRPGLPSKLFIDRHPFAMRRMPGNRSSDLSTIARHLAAKQSLVDFFYFTTGELRRKGEVRIIVLGDHETAAGVLVEPMNDAGPRHSANATELAAAMMQQSIDQRMLFIACGRMHHHARTLVDDEQHLVFKNDVQRNLLWLRFRWPRRGPMHFDGVARARSLRRLH